MVDLRDSSESQGTPSGSQLSCGHLSVLSLLNLLNKILKSTEVSLKSLGYRFLSDAGAFDILPSASTSLDLSASFSLSL